MEKKWLVFLFGFLVFFFLILLGEGVYYWVRVRESPLIEETSLIEEASLTYQSAEMEATGNIDIYPSPNDNERTAYFIPEQRFTPTGRKTSGWIEVMAVGGLIGWIQEDSHYVLVEH